MSATAPSAKLEETQPEVKKVAWEEFEAQYATLEDEWKYEWVDGIVEKSPRAMNTKQLYIFENLDSLLDKLRVGRSEVGRFYPESDIFLSEKIHRKPDIPYFTSEQIRAAKSGERIVPAFAIEVISPNDNANHVARKVKQYFEGGMQVVWHIYPENQEVHVYENASLIRVCRDEEECSAEKVIPGFALPAKAIFA